MTAPAFSAPRPPFRPVTWVVLFIPTAWLGFLSGNPFGFGLFLAGAAAVAAAALRVVRSGTVAAFAPVPALAALALEASTAPLGFGTEIVAGLAGLTFLVWLADDPARPAGGALRALPTIVLPALALGIAWTSALFLPAGSVPLGVAGVLLAVTIAAIAFLVSRPDLFDREEARS